MVFNKIKDLWDFENNYWNFFNSMHVHHTPPTLLPKHFEKIKGFTTRLELNFWNAMTICKFWRYIYSWVLLDEFAIVAFNTPHHIWKRIFIKNMCNSMQLGATMLQVKYPNKFLMQNAHKWIKWLHSFHEFIHQWTKSIDAHFNQLATNALSNYYFVINDFFQCYYFTFFTIDNDNFASWNNYISSLHI
jgi:hypothetical protein